VIPLLTRMGMRMGTRQGGPSFFLSLIISLTYCNLTLSSYTRPRMFLFETIHCLYHIIPEHRKENRIDKKHASVIDTLVQTMSFPERRRKESDRKNEHASAINHILAPMITRRSCSKARHHSYCTLPDSDSFPRDRQGVG